MISKLEIFFRQEVIDRLQNQHGLVILVTTSLTSYMDKVRQLAKGKYTKQLPFFQIQISYICLNRFIKISSKTQAYRYIF